MFDTQDVWNSEREVSCQEQTFDLFEGAGYSGGSDGLSQPSWAATRNAPGQIRYTILGTLKIWNGHRDCTPTTPKVLQVLALLLLRANRTVEVESLIDELWGERPPRSALTTIQTYIYHLRRLIERESLAEAGGDILVTKNPGYLLRVRPEQIDLQNFWMLRQRGRAHVAERRFGEASADFRAALRLWTENPLANVRLGRQLSAQVIELQEQRRNTLQLAIEADMEMGMHRELVAELRSLTAVYPLDEWFHRQLMRVLDRSGRRSDALWTYRSLRNTLGEELGINPAPETQELHCQLLE
ncbi:AfsR/SARP family transcriptional regulator [Frankia sp. AiPs1]|uniref:AfsR/SARP family transcriptional regulator n=1 Tax=Frankia sp. AiPs1 TaxID=573493 RepID=UPI00204432AB|nr:AfsR/SARP family transcriptional regulator [Frankia sp. AiPs1]MCM3921332.1 AfsR/SARP family transcriptional regulator [Frankia sp. AiPs1]